MIDSGTVVCRLTSINANCAGNVNYFGTAIATPTVLDCAFSGYWGKQLHNITGSFFSKFGIGKYFARFFFKSIKRFIH